MLELPPTARMPHVGVSNRPADTSTVAGSALPKTIATVPASSSLSTFSATAMSASPSPLTSPAGAPGQHADEVAVAADRVAAAAQGGQVDRRGVALAEDDEDRAGPQRCVGGAARDEDVVEAVAVDVARGGDHVAGAAGERARAGVERTRARHGAVDPEAVRTEGAEGDPPTGRAAHDVCGTGVPPAERVGQRRADDHVVTPVAVDVAGRRDRGAGQVAAVLARQRQRGGAGDVDRRRRAGRRGREARERRRADDRDPCHGARHGRDPASPSPSGRRYSAAASAEKAAPPAVVRFRCGARHRKVARSRLRPVRDRADRPAMKIGGPAGARRRPDRPAGSA